MKEIWKPIKGFENKYEVSNLGNVRSLDRYSRGKSGSRKFVKGKVLKPQSASGYLQVYLLLDGKQKWFKIHRLVADAFIPNPNHLPLINHIDGNTLNNNECNLEWCDCRYNVIHGIITRKSLGIEVKDYIPCATKEYHKKYSKNYYRDNKDRIKAYMKEYYQKNREIILKKYHEK